MDEAVKSPFVTFPWLDSIIVQASITASTRSRYMTPNIKSIAAGFPENE